MLSPFSLFPGALRCGKSDIMKLNYHYQRPAPGTPLKILYDELLAVLPCAHIWRTLGTYIYRALVLPGVSFSIL